MKKTFTKRITTTIAAAFMLLGFTNANAQIMVDFENLTLATDTFWDGSDGSGEFTDGSYITFFNSYNTSWFSWSGFAYGNMTDTITNDYTNQFSSWAGKGAGNSANYAVVYDNGSNRMVFAAPYVLKEFYYSNTTIAARIMRDGDPNMFAKQFGGLTGNDPDYFKIIAKGYAGGSIVASEEIILADYTFSNNTLDFIIKDWTKFDAALTSFDNVAIDSLDFGFASSDTSVFSGTTYINTPLYFALDNIKLDITTGVKNSIATATQLYPNPAKNLLFVRSGENTNTVLLKIYDYIGKLVISETVKNNTALNVEFLNAGIYLAEINVNGKKEVVKFIKE